jgi:N6-L-threonylcarbamoyladenine synthase
LRVLGIETSCDETAAAVVQHHGEARGAILSNVVRAQLEQHAPYAGVVPEIAARAHVEVLDQVVARALDEAGMALGEVDAVAATAGPGLIGGVMVGLVTAKALAFSVGKRLVAINHLEGHALTARLTHGVAFPYLLLLVSGGHTQLLLVEGVGHYRRLGTTIDDAIGEAFDKAAKLMGLGFPGGPAVERAAASGNPKRFALPRPLSDRETMDFSLSGLKTALRQAAQAHAPLNDQDVADFCASFQAAVVAIVVSRVRRASRVAREAGATTLVAAGGVAANGAIRAGLEAIAQEEGLALCLPPPALCTDNAAMIAWAGAERLACGEADGLDAPARPRWPLDEAAMPVLGSGRLGAKA